ncbi:MAG: lytic murein transglycosylase, partial [Rhodobacteraceae bacterium]|nr:lytic murein transglycosylase [Paracoccaceae bacterium]
MAARAAAFGLSLILLPGCLGAGSVDRSVRPEPRPPAAAAVTAPAHAGFAAWVEGFRPRALRAGIGAATFARAFAGAAYAPAIVARDRRQPEFTRAIWDYLDSAVSEARIANGRA